MVPVTRIHDIARGKRAITADTALRLLRYFGTTAQYWMNQQTNHELELAGDGADSSITSRIRPSGPPETSAPALESLPSPG